MDAVKRMLASVTSFSIGLGVEGFNLGVERDITRASTGSLEMDLQDVVEDISLAIRGEGKGLPSLPAHLADSRSYAERLFEYRTVDRLSESAAHESLAGPVEDLDAEYTEEAMEVMLRESGCYPYFLQEFGSAMWTVAETSQAGWAKGSRASALPAPD